jgi:hypothetical protein
MNCAAVLGAMPEAKERAGAAAAFSAFGAGAGVGAVSLATARARGTSAREAGGVDAHPMPSAAKAIDRRATPSIM